MTEQKKKRPLGLGASKSKAPKLDVEEKSHEETEETQVGANLFFDLPENDESEEAQLDAIFKAAENAVGEYKDACADDGDDEVALKDKALALLNAVINECNRCISEAEEKGEKIPDIFFRFLIDSVIWRETLGKKLKVISREYKKLVEQNRKEEHCLEFVKSVLEAAAEDHSAEAWFKFTSVRVKLLETVILYGFGGQEGFIEALEDINDSIASESIHASDEAFVQKICQLIDDIYREMPEDLIITLQILRYIGLTLYDGFGEDLPDHLKIPKGNWLARIVEDQLASDDTDEAKIYLDRIKELLPIISIEPEDEDGIEDLISLGELVLCLLWWIVYIVI